MAMYSNFSKVGERLFWQKTTMLLFVVILCVISAAITFFLVYFFIGIPINMPVLNAQGFIVVIGVLYTFASLIIGLFGIINYFQSSEALRRLTELEIEFRHNARELVVMRVFVLFLSNAKIMKTVQNTKIAGSFMIHCFRVADSKDMTPDDGEGIFDLQVSFLEILKLGGVGVCSEILNILEGSGAHRKEYAVCLVEFKKLIGYYKKFEI
jgi:hypothetical protein